MCLATIPTVGDAIEALHDICGDLADTLKQIADITAELASRDHIRVENIEEVSLAVFPAIYDKLIIVMFLMRVHSS